MQRGSRAARVVQRGGWNLIHGMRHSTALSIQQVVEGPDGGVLVEVQYMGQAAHFSPIQLVAMILVDEREIAVADGHPVTDCVVTVPVFYNEVSWLRHGHLCQLCAD